MANIQIKNKEPVLGILYIIVLFVYPVRKKFLSGPPLEILSLAGFSQNSFDPG